MKNETVYRTVDSLNIVDDRFMDVVRLSEIGMNSSLFFHEVKNILSKITVASYITKKKIKEEDTKNILEFLGEVDCSLGQINKLTNEFLFYSLKKHELDRSNLIELIERTLNLFLKNFHQTGISIEKRYNPKACCNVQAGETFLSHIFLNLINNAVHAMEGERGENKIIISVEQRRQKIKVSIKNTGPVISRKILPHIFDPFFTTKASGKGTGLGLFFVKQTMKKWGGDVTVKSDVKDGTIFMLLFPYVKS